MKLKRLWFLLFWVVVSCYGEGRLPSWRDGEVKRQILAYVDAVTDRKSADFIPERDRVAALDLDGTLIAENPINFQRILGVKRLKQHATVNPELRNIQPYKAAWEGDSDFYNAKKNHSWVFLEAFKNHTEEDFQKYVSDFISSAEKMPYWDKEVEELFYKPGIELVNLLQEKGFETYICSRSEEGCIRALCEGILGLKPLHVIGNHIQRRVEKWRQKVSIVLTDQFRAPENRGDHKCIYLNIRCGKQPVFAFGNTTGDGSMLKMAGGSTRYKNFVMILDHDDGVRELEYHDKALLGEAKEYGWVVASMKRDFKEVF